MVISRCCFCGGRHGIVIKCVPHVQHAYFSSVACNVSKYKNARAGPAARAKHFFSSLDMQKFDGYVAGAEEQSALLTVPILLEKMA